MKNKIFGIILAGIIIFAGSAAIYFMNIPPEISPNGDGDGGVYPISDVVQFSEVMFSPSHQDDEWAELYLYNNLTGIFSGWVLGIVGGKNLTIPDTEVTEYGYLAVHFGSSGGNPSSNTQYSKHVYLNETAESLNNTGGALHFIHPNGSVVDSVVWGTSPSGVQLWNSSISPAYTTDPNKSISIWGKDLNSAENWYESHPTPGKPNVDIFNITTPDITIEIYNGYHKPDMNLSEGYFVGAPEVIVHPTDVGKKNEIEEYTESSLKLYNQKGYGDPELGPDGKVDIHVGKGKKTYSTGETTMDGSVYINVGTMESNVWLKYVVEHELFHTIQYKKIDNTTHLPAVEERWWIEGMAVWWGIKSTMKNFPNLTLTQVMDEFKRVGGHSWDTHWTSMNLNLFEYWREKFDNYMGSYFFIKFLNETYGMGTLKNIHDRIERDADFKLIVGAEEAIENELGKSFEKILQQFYEWRVLNATRDNGAPVSKSDITLNFTSTEVNDTIIVKPTGAALEQINILNETEEIGIMLESNKDLMITVIIYYKNGLEKVTHFKMDSTFLSFPVSSKNVSKIQLIKQNLNDTAKATVNMWAYPVPIERTGTINDPISVTLYEPIKGWLPDLFYPDSTGTSVWYNLELFAGEEVWIALYQNHYHYSFDGAYSNFKLRFLDGAYNEIFVLDAFHTYTDEMWTVLDTGWYYVVLDANGYMGFYEYWFGIY